MKHISNFNYYSKKINEGYKNSISDYLTDFIDFFDCQVKVHDLGVVDLYINSKNEDFPRLLSLYQEAIDRMRSDDHQIRQENYTYISFSEGGKCHIRIERILQDKMTEFEFSTPAQRTAYNALSECFGEQKLVATHQGPNLDKFDLESNGSSYVQYLSIYHDGCVRLPLLRGTKTNTKTELPFNQSDCGWFKKILWLDKNPDRTSSRLLKNEFHILHSTPQLQLRELYELHIS